jgi:hypothetical protein
MHSTVLAAAILDASLWHLTRWTQQYAAIQLQASLAGSRLLCTGMVWQVYGTQRKTAADDM